MMFSSFWLDFCAWAFTKTGNPSFSGKLLVVIPGSFSGNLKCHVSCQGGQVVFSFYFIKACVYLHVFIALQTFLYMFQDLEIKLDCHSVFPTSTNEVGFLTRSFAKKNINANDLSS